MPLKTTVASLDDIGAEHQSLYVQKGDVFVLDLEGVDTHPEVANLKSAYERVKQDRDTIRTERDDAKAKLANLPEDFDPQTWKRAKEGKADPAELIQLRQTLEAERDEWKGKAEQGDKRVYELTVERELDGLLAQHGVSEPVFLEAARGLLKPQIKVEDGKPVVDTDMGPLGLNEYVGRWISDKGKAFVSPAKGGGAGGSGTPAGKKFSEMSETERLNLRRTKPEEFRRLQQEHSAAQSQ